jgi:hypothetical protein
MSEISFISNQYTSLLDTTEKINRATITLKKDHLLKSDRREEFKALSVSEENIMEARKEISTFLKFLLDAKETHAQNFEILPKNILKEFQKTIMTIVPTFVDDIKAINNQIAEDKDLDEKQLSILDEIVSTLNNERANLFTKLRTARG